MPRRIAVLGGGASGLSAIKACLEEGLEPVCYERTGWVGGLWYYTEEVKDGHSCVMKSTVINTSKEIMSYSDFPVPADYPVFMHNTMVIKYLREYADKFDLTKHIKFKHNIELVKPRDDFEKTGEWEVEVIDQETGVTSTEVFDGVMVCTGHHADKRIPEFPGMESFKGKVVHTHDYRDAVGYEGKRVVVIGIGNSGGDVAVELSRISDQVYLSTRRGSWVINRIQSNGHPVDLKFIRRYLEYIRKSVPRAISAGFAEAELNARFNHANYGLKPKHRADAQHPMVNDEMPNRIASGTIKIVKDIKKIGPTTVEFVDGTVVENVDVIILATGFTFGFPFIKHPAMEVKNNEVNLFKYVFPPDIRPGTLAVIGCVQPLGAIMPISEIMCRWAAHVFAGNTKLPSPEAMWCDIREKRQEMRERYVDSPRHTIQVDYIDIMDQVGEQFGVKPDLRALWLSDPILAWKCVFGSFVPYQYRLHGPHAWPGARNAIMTLWDRTIAGTRPIKEESPTSMTMTAIVVLLAAVVLWWIFNVLF